ncbi:Nascent polypeptide-associated complex subunit alpha-like protein [Melia azedarach]|uniref:Nascent polypeptide-associated complex subunit alpha-like protein n=1 Tax=Melia azedarach TaxID=155640 RepID=A0ACC1X7Y7_MELAZ|nr:Nascent polypeptide-associated complex subunit alpha-like protein [Melia azedarach]
MGIAAQNIPVMPDEPVAEDDDEEDVDDEKDEEDAEDKGDTSGRSKQSRSEKKRHKAMLKLGMKPIPGMISNDSGIGTQDYSEMQVFLPKQWVL